MRPSLIPSHYFFRVIDTAAICVQNSLGFTFLHQKSKEGEEEEDDLAEHAHNSKGLKERPLAEAEADEDEVRISIRLPNFVGS